MNGIFKKKEFFGRGVLLVNVWDIYRDEMIDPASLDRVEISELEEARFQVNEGDVLFCRSSLKPEGVGWSCLVGPVEEPTVFECHLIKATSRKSRLLPEYLNYYTKTTFARSYVIAKATVTTMATIDQGAIEALPIILPGLHVQRKLVGEMQAAREARKQKLSKADELLASLDAYLLETLGITAPSHDDRQTFAVRLKDAQRDHRLNADYFHPERIRAIKMLHTTTSTRLADVVDFKRDQCLADASENYIGLAHVQSHTGELVPADEETSGQCFAFQLDDVLFARLRPYLNKVHRAERAGVCSTEFHVMRIRDRSRVSPDYVAAMLRSSLIVAQTRHMMTGNTHPRLANQDVVDLIIPIPSNEIQQKIAAEVRRRREQARRLRAGAEAEWAAAKRRFEEQLLNRDSAE
jgi:hypothetical protein